MAKIFLSYARNDDESFVKRLYEDLIKKGFNVWWDRVSMPSRDLTFLQEIRDAIDSSERLILVVGPKAVCSDYVLAEWRYAFQECKVIIPILRLGDYKIVPPELSKLHCPDMREKRAYESALQELLRILDESIMRFGILHGVPSLPAHFLPRTDEIDHLAETVLADIKRPTVISSVQKITVLHGMGGVGKSVVAAAFARACEIRRAFIDGIIWLTIGQQPNLVKALNVVGESFGDDSHYYHDIKNSIARLGEVLADKVCLLVLDDVWDVKHTEAFINTLGVRCRLLITTRDSGLANTLGARGYKLEVLVDEAALKLLADWTDQTKDTLPALAYDIARECGNLPFALSLCGAMVHEGMIWSDLLAALRDADLAYLEQQFPNYPYPNVLRSLQVSMDVLEANDPLGAKYFRELVLFPPDWIVPEAVVVMLWSYANGLSERNARKLLVSLECKALLRLEGEAPHRFVSLHDLQYDYLRTIHSSFITLNEKLLKAYWQKCTNGWPTGPNDGYFFEHLDYHMVQAGRKEELRQLLLDFNWLQAKLDATNIADLINDFDPLVTDNELHLVHGALRLSAHILTRDKRELAGQLLGRLLNIKQSGIQSLLRQAQTPKLYYWLRPLISCLRRPGGPLELTLVGHTDDILGVAVTPDGSRAISASKDKTLKVWNLQTGALERTLLGHTDEVNAVSITGDGLSTISASKDGTLKVWNLQTGTEERTLCGHKGGVNGLAILESNEKRVISASADGTLKLWRLQIGTEELTLSGHTGGVNAVVPIGTDGLKVISASDDNTLKVWNLITGTAELALTGHTRRVVSLAVTPDGARAVSGSDDETINIWNLKTGCLDRTLTGNPFWVRAVSVTPDGKRIISSAYDDLQVWDLRTGNKEYKLAGHSLRVWAVVVTQDGTRAISGSQDSTLKVWNLQTDSLERERGVIINGKVVLTSDGMRAITKSENHALKVWNLKTFTEERILAGHTESINAVAVTPDGTRVISASDDKTLKVWNLITGELEYTLIGHQDGIQVVTITPDVKYAISGSSDGALKVWNILKGNLKYSLIHQTGGQMQSDFTINTIAVTPNSTQFISGAGVVFKVAAPLKVWDLNTGTEIYNLSGHNQGVNYITLTPDGKSVISTSFDHAIKVWSLQTGTETYTLSENFGDMIWSLEATPNGEQFISGSCRGDLKIWNLQTGVEASNLIGHTEGITQVAITQDGKRIVSVSWDNTVKVWELVSGRLLASFSGDGRMVACAITPDGKMIVAVDEFGGAYFLKLEGID